MALRTIFRIQIVLTATLVTAANKGETSPLTLKSAHACSWYAFFGRAAMRATVPRFALLRQVGRA